MEMVRETPDVKSWTNCAIIGVAVLGVVVALVLLFLPWIENQTKSSSGTVKVPNPQPKDHSFWQDQGGNLYKDSKGNIFTGTMQYVNTLDGNWNKLLWGDETYKYGICWSNNHSVCILFVYGFA